ncbi:MAG: hypothetical protein EOP06_12160 [Proteobacteria bacterium]|nr:MAG: hypothetical protein EOP06_12160 [Pseudomonadota bacterium]
MGTTVSLVVTSAAGGTWFCVKEENRWVLTDIIATTPNTEVIIDPETAWKLFSKSWRPGDVIDRVKINGDEGLGRKVLEMVSVMG